jgi:hypothetical protein
MFASHESDINMERFAWDQGQAITYAKIIAQDSVMSHSLICSALTNTHKKEYQVNGNEIKQNTKQIR